MDAQELAALLATYRARREQLQREQLQRLQLSGTDPWELRQHALELARVETAIELGEQLLERLRERAERAAGTPSTSPRDQEQPVIEAQSNAGVRPLFHRDEFECWLPEVNESLLADFEEDKED